MKNNVFRIAACLCFLLASFSFARNSLPVSHEESALSESNSLSFQDPDVKTVLQELKNALSTGDVTLLAKYLSDQTYLSLFTGVSGYYSGNQAFYVLQDFFSINKPIQFTYTAQNSGANPYATGTLEYESRSRRTKAQVYLSLKAAAAHWKLSQLSIR